MAGKWIDLVIMVICAVAIWRGFRRGIIREVFSLFGVLLAVAVAFHRYEGLSLWLMVSYPLIEWQAQLIAFVILAVGISMIAMFLGFIWSKAVRFTPLALIDGILGATFGTVKVIVLVTAAVVILHSLNVAAVEGVLADSLVVRQVDLLWPHLRMGLERAWPEDWAKPGWMFPQINLDDEGSELNSPPPAAGFSHLWRDEEDAPYLA
ncbi:MAG: CvpA family protein [Firmicutes bacterium]|jgi:membrane protein required for colicin V production|nr:CvpA family protein [Bacillota bacterium]NLL87742.1 CvpA family protein [Bacillota bacterium]